MKDSLYKNWWVHNCLAHPIMQITKHNFPKLSKSIHDGTLPRSSKSPKPSNQIDKKDSEDSN